MFNGARAGSGGPLWIKVDRAQASTFHTPADVYDGHPIHRVVTKARLNLDRILDDHRQELIYSDRLGIPRSGMKDWLGWNTLTFKLVDESFVQIEDRYEDELHRLTVWSHDLEIGGRNAAEWVKSYGIRQRKGKPCTRFYILQPGGPDFIAHAVDGFKPFVLAENELALHYGADFPSWEKGFVQRFQRETTGAAILTGPPGTGKTSFIRHAIHKLRKTHRFYYLPVSEYPILSSPLLVGFWAKQHRLHPKMKFVVILEDAESLLMVRSPDNANQVSNLLNMADGLLGEFLKLQVLCTINCKLDKLDPAVVRSNRLIGFRPFRRLTRGEATSLARIKGLSLPPGEDFSLAEIYGGPPVSLGDKSPTRLGFNSPVVVTSAPALQPA